MSDITIREIEAITAEQIFDMAEDTAIIKDHEVYFIDFGGYFGYSAVVFKGDHHISYANDYELHHRGKTKEELKALYIEAMNNKLFTEEELRQPITDYSEAQRKEYFLRNYYHMRTDYISCFFINSSPKEEKDFRKAIKGKTLDLISFAYIEDAEFVKHHNELFKAFKAEEAKLSEDYSYYKDAFLSEMYNHEYGINWQADFDTLSAFGNIGYHGADISAYFEELKFTDTQKHAYMDARAEYLKHAEF